MERNIKASDIIAKALELLWDGSRTPGERFACLAVAVARGDRMEHKIGYTAATQDSDVTAIREKIINYIGGHSNADFYINELKGLPEGREVPAEEGQAFRKKMLEEILAECLKEEALAMIVT